jgi:hypothetical protein
MKNDNTEGEAMCWLGISDLFSTWIRGLVCLLPMKKPHDCKKTIQIRGAIAQVLALA